MTSKTQTDRFVGKWQLTTLRLFFLKIKIERKRKLDSFLFYGETALNYLKLLGHPTRESAFNILVNSLFDNIIQLMLDLVI